MDTQLLKKNFIAELSKFLPYKHKEEEKKATQKVLEKREEIQKILTNQIIPLQQKAIESNKIATIK